MVERVVRIRRDDITELHRAAYRVQHDDASGHCLVDGTQPGLDGDAKRPDRPLESHVVVVPGLGEQIGAKGTTCASAPRATATSRSAQIRVLSVMCAM